MGSLQRSEISAQTLSINKNGPSNKHEGGHLARGKSIFRDRDSKRPEQSVLVCGGGGGAWRDVKLSGGLRLACQAPSLGASVGRWSPRRKIRRNEMLCSGKGIHRRGWLSLPAMRILILRGS